jgi:hypothetical protein
MCHYSLNTKTRYIKKSHIISITNLANIYVPTYSYKKYIYNILNKTYYIIIHLIYERIFQVTNIYVFTHANGLPLHATPTHNKSNICRKVLNILIVKNYFRAIKKFKLKKMYIYIILSLNLHIKNIYKPLIL